jgi:hypothetical protein
VSAPGESARYDALRLYRGVRPQAGISVFRPPPSLQELGATSPALADQEAFGRIFGSARPLSTSSNWPADPDHHRAHGGGRRQLHAVHPGTPINLLTRPLSLAPRWRPKPAKTCGGCSCAAPRDAGRRHGRHRRQHGRVGSCARGADLRTGVAVDRILVRDGRVTGVATAGGEEFLAPVVIAACNPRCTVVDLLRDADDWAPMRAKMRRRPMTGKAFKVVLALDGVPAWAAAPPDADPVALASAQFRIAPSIDYLEASHAEMQQGRISDKPVVWGSARR